MRIGFGGIGKGYAADMAKKRLVASGVESGIVNAAGDLVTWGNQPGGKPWSIAIADPDQAGVPFSTLDISNMAVATSGNYEKFVIIDGKKYSHTIDPVTGLPVNRLIEDSEPLDVQTLVTDKVRQFQELLSAQQVQVVTDLQSRPIEASRYLVDILLNNLLSNAIRHNHPSGKIYMTLSDTCFVCENSGLLTALDAETIFDRFQKSHKSEGTGLGLTIVKNVCHLYHWELRYYFHDGRHAFEILF